MNERDEDNWIYRRDQEINLDERKAVLFTEKRIPYLCPEAVLLYKTKELSDKDCENIVKALKKINKTQIEWLIEKIKDQRVKEKVRNLTTVSTL